MAFWALSAVFSDAKLPQFVKMHSLCRLMGEFTGQMTGCAEHSSPGWGTGVSSLQNLAAESANMDRIKFFETVIEPSTERLGLFGIAHDVNFDGRNFCLLYTSPSPRDA